MREALVIKSMIPGLSDHSFMILLMMLLDYVIVATFFALGTLQKHTKLGGPRNLMEWAVMFVCNYADDIIGKKDAPHYYPLLLMLFFYILVGNFLGLIPGLVSPTSMLSVTATLAVSVWVFTWFEGIRRKGIVKYFAHFAGGPGIPWAIRPFLFFIELLSDFSRPISLAFRLFGNLMAKEILLSVLVTLVLLLWPYFMKDGISTFLAGFSFVLRPLIIWLGVLISIIQAGVFTLLTATYITSAIASHEDHEETH